MAHMAEIPQEKAMLPPTNNFHFACRFKGRLSCKSSLASSAFPEAQL